MKKLQLLTITMLFALAGINTVEAGRVSSMMKRLKQEDAAQQESTPNDVTTMKLPGESSVKKMAKKIASGVTSSGTTKVASIKPEVLEKLREEAKNTGVVADVKHPSAASVKKMAKQAKNMVKQVKSSVNQAAITPEQLTKIKETVKKKAKIIVEMLQNSSKQNEVILEMVQDLAS